MPEPPDLAHLFRSRELPKAHPLWNALDACLDFHDFVLARIPRVRVPPDDVVGNIIFAEWSRIVILYHGVISLAMDGNGISGLILSRPMFESLVSAWWVHNHPEEAPRYLLHAKIIDASLVDRAESVGYENLNFVGTPREDLDLSDEEKEQASAWWGPTPEMKHWTGRGVPFLARDHAQRQAGLVAGIDNYIDFNLRMVNWLLHSTPVVPGFLFSVDHEGNSQSNLRPSAVLIIEALSEAINALNSIAGLLDTHFGLGLRPELFGTYQMTRDRISGDRVLQPALDETRDERRERKLRERRAAKKRRRPRQ